MPPICSDQDFLEFLRRQFHLKGPNQLLRQAQRRSGRLTFFQAIKKHLTMFLNWLRTILR
jgi:hypothetical protein